MPLVVRVTRGGGRVDTLPFTLSPVRIGRNPLNEVCLEEPMVSQWHALIRFDDSQRVITLMDLGSTNGTGVNGKKIQSRFPMVVGQNDVLNIGPLRLNLMLTHLSQELLESSVELRTISRDSGFNIRALSGPVTIAPTADAFLQHVAKKAPQGDFAATVLASPDAEPTKVKPTPGAVQLVEGTTRKTRPAYEAYRSAWQEVIRQVRARIEEVPPHLRQAVAIAHKAEYREIAHEPEFRDLMQELGMADAVDPADWLHRLKHGARSAAPRESINVRLAMERVGALLEVFSEAFVALRRGYDQFGEDMAVKVVEEKTPLSTATDHRGVLQVLLDWNADGTQVVDEVKRAFAQVAMHQVAHLYGVVEGVRYLLQEVSPTALATGRSSLLEGRQATSGFPWSVKARLWRLYETVHRSLIEEDHFTRVVFGRSFHRAYLTVTGATPEDSLSVEPDKLSGRAPVPLNRPSTLQ
jgi:predicted component of type VI protein secretion system